MKKIKNIIIVFFFILNNYCLGNPFENCFPCSYFFEKDYIKNNDTISEECKDEILSSSNNIISEDSSFFKKGLDIYCFDDFADGSIEKYNKIVYNKVGNYIKDKIKEEVDNTIKTNEDAWIWHFYPQKNEEDNKTFIEKIAKQMSTEGGNNFDWEEKKDKTETSKGRHNKNVIIIKLKEENDDLFKEAIFNFRNFVNMSYCPIPIIFTGNFDYEKFEEDLKNFNNEYTEKNKKKNVVINLGDVDFGEPIDEKTCFYIKQDGNFVTDVKEKLNLAVNFHNTKGEEKFYETFNIAIIGAKRAGKSTLTTRLLNNLCGKTGNDACSVSNKIGKFFHAKGEKIPIAVIDVPGFEVGEHYDSNLINWITQNENEDKKKIHAIVYLINANNLPKPDEFGKPLKDNITGREITKGELFLEQEVKVFKILKGKKIPVIFCIARSQSVENGYKYLRKFFGDLALNNELSNYQSKDENWKAEDQWICNKWTRGTLLQLKADTDTGLFGLVRLLTCIQELYKNNAEYKKRLPESFKENNKLNNLFKDLKKEILETKWNGKKFVNDDKEGILRSKNGKDIIFAIFEKPLIESLKQLHEKKNYINEKNIYAKRILNYICAYDYSVPNEQIAKKVLVKMKTSNFLFKLASFFTMDSTVEEIIKASLPDQKYLEEIGLC